MPFSAGLRQSLQARDCQFESEFTQGDSLEDVLDRHLLAVEEMAEIEIITSILLLSPDGRRLSHGAGPNLPQAYRDSIDGSEIGPTAGSCGTAAYFGRPVYVTDIETDPLWAEYRHLALPHRLRSCWSTPIRGEDGSVIGTFAIYHRTVGSPTKEELQAIDMITDHVAHAISWARDGDGFEFPEPPATRKKPQLRLVTTDRPQSDALADPVDEVLTKVARLENMAADLERQAVGQKSEECREQMNAAAILVRRLASAFREQVERLRH